MNARLILILIYNPLALETVSRTQLCKTPPSVTTGLTPSGGLLSLILFHGRTPARTLKWRCVQHGTAFFSLFFFFSTFFVSGGKFWSPYVGKAQQPQEQRYPFLLVCVVVSCVQTMIWLPVFGIFNVRTDVD